MWGLVGDSWPPRPAECARWREQAPDCACNSVLRRVAHARRRETEQGRHGMSDAGPAQMQGGVDQQHAGGVGCGGAGPRAQGY